MADKIARVLRRPVPSEIVGRSDRDLTQLLAEGRHHHVPLDDLADADGDVETASDDVDHLVVQVRLSTTSGTLP